MQKKILPIIVLYKEKLSDALSINSLLDSDTGNKIKDIFVYDNTPEGFGLEVGRIDHYKNRNVIYISDFQNSGVSTAYNRGMVKAQEMGYKYILLLDQDTQFPSEAYQAYLDAIDNHPEVKLFAPRLVTLNGEYCSPLKYALHRGFVVGELEPGLYPLKKYSPINSGMLIDVETAIRSGGYREEVYLDFSDFQFVEKLLNVIDSFMIIPLTLKQNLSNEESNIHSLLSRYKIYCDCAKNCRKDTIIDHSIYFFMVLIRGLKLTKRTREFRFLSVFLNYFIRGKK